MALRTPPPPTILLILPPPSHAPDITSTARESCTADIGQRVIDCKPLRKLRSARIAELVDGKPELPRAEKQPRHGACVPAHCLHA